MVGGGGGGQEKALAQANIEGWWGLLRQLRKYKYNEFVRVENINNVVRIRTRG